MSMEQKTEMYIEGEYYRAFLNGKPVIVEYGLIETVTEGEYFFSLYGFKSIENGLTYGIGELRNIDRTPIKRKENESRNKVQGLD